MTATGRIRFNFFINTKQEPKTVQSRSLSTLDEMKFKIAPDWITDLIWQL